MKEVCLYETCFLFLFAGVVAPPLSSCALGMPWESMGWQLFFMGMIGKTGEKYLRNPYENAENRHFIAPLVVSSKQTTICRTALHPQKKCREFPYFSRFLRRLKNVSAMFSAPKKGIKRNLGFDSPPMGRVGRFPTKSRPPAPRFPIIAYIVAGSLNRYTLASIFKKEFQVLQAYSILRHALIMIFTEFPTTLRTLRAGLAITAAGVLILVVAAPNLIQAGDIPNANAVGGTFFLGVLICIFGYVVMIVSWHRYVLMNNTTGALPPSGIVFRYIGTVVLLALLAIVCSLTIFTPISILTFASQNLALGTLLSILAIALIGWIIMRCSLPLPAISIGAPMTFSDSWTTTRPVSGTIFLVMVAVSLLNAGISVLPDLLLSNLAAAYAIAQVVLSMLTALISASVLTTLYGMLIEGRPLPD